MTEKTKLYEDLTFVYGTEQGEHVYDCVMEKLQNMPRLDREADWVSEKDVMLITYGDQVQDSDCKPLQSLHQFAEQFLKPSLSAIHILPFYPYTSDDGFSVVDYTQVDPALGEWEDVERLSQSFDLMFDAVINHISRHSPWFQGYLNGDPKYENFFIEADPDADYSTVTRPRALPLLTEVETSRGRRHVWTTFSDDQIDLNYANPEVFLAVLDVLLFYVSKGAKYIRLDAIGYLWKELGTSCIHLEQTHRIVQAYRQVLDEAAPGTVIITETNVPHKDNVRYFGDGADEAHMVYQFPLPPLTLYSFLTGDARPLTSWAKQLEAPKPGTSFFNFLASHDGIGLMPARGILGDSEIDYMVSETHDRGGYVGYKDNGDGTKSPYELNINYFSALKAPDDSQSAAVKKFLGAQTILLSMAGVPGIYFHSLVGSENYRAGAEESGIPRRINRQKLSRQRLEQELRQTGTVREEVFSEFTLRIQIRRRQPAFHPDAEQRIIENDPRLFVILRGTGQQSILAVVNSSADTVETELGLPEGLEADCFQDLIGGARFSAADGILKTTLGAHDCLWLLPQ